MTKRDRKLLAWAKRECHEAAEKIKELEATIAELDEEADEHRAELEELRVAFAHCAKLAQQLSRIAWLEHTEN